VLVLCMESTWNSSHTGILVLDLFRTSLLRNIDRVAEERVSQYSLDPAAVRIHNATASMALLST
jgi:hypothetical protein